MSKKVVAVLPLNVEIKKAFSHLSINAYSGMRRISNCDSNYIIDKLPSEEDLIEYLAYQDNISNELSLNSPSNEIVYDRNNKKLIGEISIINNSKYDYSIQDSIINSGSKTIIKSDQSLYLKMTIFLNEDELPETKVVKLTFVKGESQYRKFERIFLRFEEKLSIFF